MTLDFNTLRHGPMTWLIFEFGLPENGFSPIYIHLLHFSRDD